MQITLELSPTIESVTFARQLGLTRCVSSLRAEGSSVISSEIALERQEFFARHGIRWEVTGLPHGHYYRAMLGLPGRDEQIDNVCHTLCNLAEAGLDVVYGVWALTGFLRTEYSPTGRGGARYSRFDQDVAERMPAASLDWLGRYSRHYPHIPHREVGPDEVWGNLLYFLERVVPVAKECGIRLAFHPDDPPISPFIGVARVLSTPEGLQRLLDSVPSPNLGLLFCQGTVATMAGVDAVEQIYHFGRQGKIFHAHFRNPRGEGRFFDEVFPDEGDTDMLAAMQAYRALGFEGLIRIDHAPGVVGDSRGAPRSNAFQLGYARGLLQAAELLEAQAATRKEDA